MTEEQFDAMRVEHNQRTLLNMANDIIKLAQATGFVVTIETRPLQPLAMRNYEMVADVRRVSGGN